MGEYINKSIIIGSVAERSKIPSTNLYFRDRQTLGITRGVFVFFPYGHSMEMLENGVQKQIAEMKQMVNFITNPHTSFKKDGMLPYIELALSNIMNIGDWFRKHGLSLPTFVLPDEIDLIRPGVLAKNNTCFQELGVNLSFKSFLPPQYERLPEGTDSLARKSKLMNFVLHPLGGKTHTFTASFLVEHQ